jgi:hypothetical protein
LSEAQQFAYNTLRGWERRPCGDRPDWVDLADESGEDSDGDRE